MIGPAAKFARKGQVVKNATKDQRAKFATPILVERMFVRPLVVGSLAKQSVAVNLVKQLEAEKFAIPSLEREFVVM
jgi:hypothetical protein